MHNGGTNLALDVVANERKACLLEAPAPFRTGCDENWDAVHERAAGFQRAFGIPFSRELRADWQVRDEHFSAGILKRRNDVHLWRIRFANIFAQVTSESVECWTALDFHARRL